MDYGRALGAEFREVQDLLHDGKPARVVAASRVYATDQHDLWDALTNAERIPRWFSPITGDLRLGGRYQLEGNAGGTITRCDPPDAFEATWEYGGSVSWVVVRLAPDGDGARLSLEHITLKDEAGEAHWDQYGPGATGVGWDLSFLGMGLHVDSGGGAVDSKANEAWMSSEDGKAFMRRCAEAWGAAHVAAGEAADVAGAMAARTTAAYAGG
ncbi:MAG: SRPBCC family protein [Pseudomonadota bacterium]